MRRAKLGIIEAELVRALRSAYLYIIPIVIFVIMASEISTDFPRAYTNKQNIMSNVGYYCFGVNFGSIVIVLPFLAAFVYAPTVSDDLYGGILPYITQRASLVKYLIAKYAVCILVSAIAVAVGFALYAVWTSILYLPSDTFNYPNHVLPLEDSKIYASLYGHHGGIAFFATHVFQMFLYGAVWSGVGIVIATIFKHRYSAPVGTMILYHVAVFVAQKLGLSYFDPSAMIVYFDANVDFSLGHVVMVQCITVLICCVVFIHSAMKRIAYD